MGFGDNKERRQALVAVRLSPECVLKKFPTFKQRWLGGGAKRKRQADGQFGLDGIRARARLGN